MFALHDGSDYRKQSSKDPDGDHTVEEGCKLERSIFDNPEPCVNGDGQDEEGRGDIADVNEKALTEAPIRVAVDLTTLKPVEADCEAQSLHQVGQGQIVHEDEVLIAAKEGAVMATPSYHEVADDGEQRACRDD